MIQSNRAMIVAREDCWELATWLHQEREMDLGKKDLWPHRIEHVGFPSGIECPGTRGFVLLRTSDIISNWNDVR